jgi:hypothetical protein
MKFNDTSGGTNYANHYISGSGSVSTSRNTSNDAMLFLSMQSRGNDSNVFTTSIIDILDFANTSKNTTVRVFNGNVSPSENYVAFHGGLWADTSAVTKINLFVLSGNFAANSRFSLYGVK